MINGYAEWLKSEISFEKFGEYYEITTPYLDSANDYLQIYVRQDKDDVCFTDDGATLNNLMMAGIQITGSRKERMEKILTQYGVKVQDGAIVAKSSVMTFPQKKHLFVQAILRIDDMFSLSKTKITSYFLEDVQQFFQQHEIYYTDNVQFTGVSGFTHSYDFLLQRSKNKPERLCQAVNNPNKTNVGNVLFAWNDTKPSRKNSDSQLIVFLNDQNDIPKGVEDAFINYDAKVIKWSEKDVKENVELLLAI